MKKPLLVFTICISLFHSLVRAEDVRSSDVSPFDYSLQQILSYDEILSQIRHLTTQLEQEYRNEEVCVLAILKGSLWFATDLMKLLKLPSCLETISCSSYEGTISRELTIRGIERLDIRGKHVLVIDDICDTGKTLSKVMEELQPLGPKSLKSVVLLSKKVRKAEDYHPDYYLFEVENLFVVGYGLDYNGYYRGLPGVYILGHAD